LVYETANPDRVGCAIIEQADGDFTRNSGFSFNTEQAVHNDMGIEDWGIHPVVSAYEYNRNM